MASEGKRPRWGWLRAEALGFWDAGRGFYHHDGFDRAAALAFWAILAFAPFLLMLVGLFGYLVDAVGGPERSALLAEVVVGLRKVFPGLGADVVGYLDRLVTERELVSVAGLSLFLVTSSALYGTLQTALRRIFHPERGRTLARAKLIALAFVLSLLGALLAFAVAWLTLARFAELRGTVTGLLLGNPVASGASIVIVGAGVFLVLVRWFALDPIPYRLLSLGGILFGILWLMARLLFSVYLDTIASYDLVYGSFATLVVILLWSYYTAVIFLYSAERVEVWRARLEERATPRTQAAVARGD